MWKNADANMSTARTFVKSERFITVISGGNGSDFPCIPLKGILCGRKTFFRTTVFINCMKYTHITEKSEQGEGRWGPASACYRVII
jgi:hypothetical protein